MGGAWSNEQMNHFHGQSEQGEECPANTTSTEAARVTGEGYSRELCSGETPSVESSPVQPRHAVLAACSVGGAVRLFPWTHRYIGGSELIMSLVPDGERDHVIDLLATGCPPPLRVVREPLKVHDQHRRQPPQTELLVSAPMVLKKRSNISVPCGDSSSVEPQFHTKMGHGAAGVVLRVMTRPRKSRDICHARGGQQGVNTYQRHHLARACSQHSPLRRIRRSKCSTRQDGRVRMGASSSPYPTSLSSTLSSHEPSNEHWTDHTSEHQTRLQ